MKLKKRSDKRPGKGGGPGAGEKKGGNVVFLVDPLNGKKPGGGAKAPPAPPREPIPFPAREPPGKKPPKKPSEFERYKRAMQRNKRLRAVVGIALITALAAGLVIAFGAASDTGFGRLFRERFARSSSYPIPLAGRTVKQLEPLGWDLVVLDNADLAVYDSKGAQSLSLRHGYVTPVLRTEGGRLLVYEQGGTRFEVANATRAISGESTAAIHAADIAQNGVFAIATSSAKSAAEVKVYDSVGTEVFTWPASSPIISLALSPDGKQAAVCLVGAQGGAMLTSVALLDLQNPQVLFKTDIPEEFGCYVSFKENGLSLLTDRSLKTIDTLGRVRGTFDFEGQQVVQFADAGLQNTVLVLGSYRYMRRSEILSLDDRCKVVGRVSTDASIEKLRADASGFYFLSEGILRRYSHKGEALPDTPAPGVVEYLPLGPDLYTASYEKLQKSQLRA